MGKSDLVGQAVILKPLAHHYVDQYLHMFSPHVRHVLHVSSLDDERVYLQQQLLEQKRDNTFFYCVFDKVLTQLVGAIEIRNPAQHLGQLYCWLNEQFWGAGHFSESLALISQAYFSSSKDNLLRAHVDVSNKRSYYALKKCGFADLGIKNGPFGKQYVLILRSGRR